MDRIQEASDVIVKINEYRRGTIKDYELIGIICAYFDKIKKDHITPSDQKFLKYISNVIGIPHYYDLLSTFQDRELEINNFDLNRFHCFLDDLKLFDALNFGDSMSHH